MDWRVRDKLIEAMFKNEPLYIRDTGVKVSIDYFGTDEHPSFTRASDEKRMPRVKIVFDSAPNMKALKMCKKYHIKKNSHSKIMELDAEIDLDKLSLYPFESDGAKVLYGKEAKKIK
jgi:hypothetical protein